MYTIVMNKDKDLIKTNIVNLYQREKLVDKIQFLIPCSYENFDLSEFTAVLKYIDPSGVSHSEILKPSEDTYKDSYLIYLLPLDTNLTQFAGDIRLRLSFNMVDLPQKRQYVLHTGETSITILPMDDYYEFISDESLEFVDKLVGEIDAKIKATEKIAETYNKTKADNIRKTGNEIQLESNGVPIGDVIIIKNDEEPEENKIDIIEL